MGDPATTVDGNADDGSDPEVLATSEASASGVAQSEGDPFGDEPGEEPTIPEGFPTPFPRPEGGRISSASTLDGGDSLLVSYSVPADPLQVVVAFRDQLEGEGYTIDRFQERADGGTFVATRDGDDFPVTVGGDLYDDAVAKVKVSYSR